VQRHSVEDWGEEREPLPQRHFHTPHIKAIRLRLPEAQPPKKAPPKKGPPKKAAPAPPNGDVCTSACPHLKGKCDKVHDACSKWPAAIREREDLLKEISRLEKLLPEGSFLSPGVHQGTPKRHDNHGVRCECVTF